MRVQRKLGINILSGFMRAYEQDSEPEVSWSGDDKVHTEQEIAVGIAEAISATNSKGSFISILIEHELVRQKAYEIPTMAGKDLQAYLNRKINEDKGFDDHATYSYLTNDAGNGKMYVTVSYLPTAFVNSIKQACLNSGAYLMQLLPIAFVVAEQFKYFPVSEGEVVALLLRLGSKSNVVIGKSTGYMLSERSISFNVEQDDVSRLAKEINRSILHNKQQFGARVSVLHIAESYPKEVLKGLQDDLSIDVGYIERSGRGFWIKEMFNISYSHQNNLVHTGARVDMFMKRFTRVATSAVLILWIGAIASVVGIEYLISNNSKNSSTVSFTPLAKIEQELQTIKAKHLKLDGTKTAIDVLQKGQPPVVGWFVGFLADAMPKGLVLTGTTVKKEQGRWLVSIEGISHHDESSMAKQIEALSKNLVKGPLILQVDNSWYDKWLLKLRGSGQGNAGLPVKFSMKGEVK